MDIMVIRVHNTCAAAAAEDPLGIDLYSAASAVGAFRTINYTLFFIFVNLQVGTESVVSRANVEHT